MVTLIVKGIIRKTRKPIMQLLCGERQKQTHGGGKDLENALGRLWI